MTTTSNPGGTVAASGASGASAASGVSEAEAAETSTVGPAAPPPPPAGLASGPQLPVAMTVVGIAAAVVSLAGIKATSAILAPALLPLFLVITFRPISTALQRRRVPPVITMIVNMLLIYGVLIFLGLSVYLAITQFATTLIQNPGKFNDLIASGTAALQSVGITNVSTSQIASLFSPSRIASLAGSVVNASTAIAGMLGLIFALTFFMALDADNFANRLRLVTRFRPHTASALVNLGKSTRSYFAVAAIFGGIVAVVDWILLAIVGVPDAWLWAILAFVTNFIPNIGFLIGVIPPAILALVTMDWQSAVIVFAGYCVINVVIQVLIQPKVVGDTVQLNTTLTFMALIIWTFILGGLGAILAIPMTLLVRALFVDSRPELRWVRVLFSSPDGPKKPQKPAKGDSAEQQPPAPAGPDPAGPAPSGTGSTGS
ncbi:AI-2E family transporter [Microlunatus ginsengisoli]|uniref:AI-2E family transporter n=1 Tax=Microlunatus ginsengisoli TaxID=363863 RepID=A0ABP7A201_9ACTN